jgi:hypothetical protein
MKNRLVAEPRIDKTGKTVIRHVLPAGAQKSGTAIPAPLPSTNLSKSEMASNISNLLLPDATESQVAYLGESISNLSGLKGLAFMESQVRSLDPDARYLMTMSILRVSGTMRNAPAREREHLAVSVAATIGTIYSFAPMSEDEFVVDVAQSAMVSASSQGYRCDGDAANESRAFLNLLALEQVIVGERSPVAPLSHLIRDAQWFDENMKRLVPYVQVLKESQNVSRKFCDDLLSSGTVPALSDGFI